MKNAPMSEDNPELTFIRKEEVQAFCNVWPTLDQKSRILLEGRFILGKSYEELAEELGIRPDSTRMAVTRAKRLAFKKWYSAMRGIV